ncbi:MAG: hypothetical protein P8Y77_08375, partial [Nitrospirota bacterium]
VGSSKSHDFVAVGRKQDVNNLLGDASRLFGRKVKSFYGEKDLSRKSVLSFVSDGKEVNMGLMRLAYSVIDSRTEIPREEILAYLEESCLA